MGSSAPSHVNLRSAVIGDRKITYPGTDAGGEAVSYPGVGNICSRAAGRQNRARPESGGGGGHVAVARRSTR
jgi:hypothetical protein